MILYPSQKSFRAIMLLTFASINHGCATIGAKMAEQEVIKMASTGCESSAAIGAVSLDKCELTNRIIKDWGIEGGLVGFDRLGRLELRGEYNTEEEVDKAFITAQTIAGTENVSQLTPRNIKVLRWHPVDEFRNDGKEVSGPGRKLALLIGISKFASGIKEIKTATNDVKKIATSLKNNGFDRPIVLIDADATRANIIKAVDNLRNNANSNDTILFYISTHGAPPDKYGQLSVIPYDFSKNALQAANFDEAKSHSDAEYLEVAKARYNTQKKYGIAPNIISDLVLKSNAKSVVGVLDLCYSGAVLGDIFKPLGSKELQEKELTSLRGVSTEQISRTLGYAGSKDLIISRESNDGADLSVHRKADYSYSDLGTPSSSSNLISGDGRVVITASGKNEQAYYDLSPGFKNTGIPESFFTHYFVEGLELSKGTTRPAFQYALPRTQRIAWDTGRKRQNPQYNTNPNDNMLSVKIFE